MKEIFERRSVRSFSGKPVEEEKIEKLLRAAMQAPSGGNGQPWEFIVVSGKENLKALAAYHVYASSLVGAEYGIVVLSNQKRGSMPHYYQQDLAAVTQNIMLEATHLGLGTVWYGCAPIESRIDFIKKLYDLPDDIIPFSVVAVGYPKDPNANKFVDRFDPSRITYVK